MQKRSWGSSWELWMRMSMMSYREIKQKKRTEMGEACALSLSNGRALPRVKAYTKPKGWRRHALRKARSMAWQHKTTRPNWFGTCLKGKSFESQIETYGNWYCAPLIFNQIKNTCQIFQDSQQGIHSSAKDMNWLDVPVEICEESTLCYCPFGRFHYLLPKTNWCFP